MFKFRYAPIVALCASIFMTSAAHAAIIDHGDYLTDTSSGLDWLDVTKSVNRSYQHVRMQFGTGGEFAGWRYATGNEFNALVSNFTGSSISAGFYGYVSQEPNKIDNLVVMLGSTLDSGQIYYNGNTYDRSIGFPEGGGLDYSYGYLLSPYPIPNETFAALIYDLDASQSGVDFSQTYYASFSTQSSSPYIGSYLVRATSTTANIPEPASLALLALGLVGIAFSRGRKNV